MPIYTVANGNVIYAQDHNSYYNLLKGTAGENVSNFYKGADIPSGSTLTLGTDGNYWHVTGTATISAISAIAQAEIMLEFDGALTLTYNATSLILAGGVSYTTVAGDVFKFVSEGSGNWREVSRLTAGSIAGFTNPMTTAFDIIYAGTAGAATRLPISGATVNMALSVASTNGMLAWRYPFNATVIPSLYNYPFVASTNGNITWGTGPYTSIGDLAVGGAGGAITRFAAVASVNNIPFVASTNGNLAWGQAGLTTDGDLLGRVAGQLTRIPIVASTNNSLQVASTNGNLKWAAAAATTVGVAYTSVTWTSTFSTTSATYVLVTNGTMSVLSNHASNPIRYSFASNMQFPVAIAAFTARIQNTTASLTPYETQGPTTGGLYMVAGSGPGTQAVASHNIQMQIKADGANSLAFNGQALMANMDALEIRSSG